MALKPKYTWIIGASTGIGAALAHRLSFQGENLCLSARNRSALQTVYAKLSHNHSQQSHLVLPCDVSDKRQLAQGVQTLSERWPCIDRIIFMAGIYEPTTLDNMTLTNMEQTIDINLKSAFILLHLVLPLLEKQGFGQIALCSSVAGYVGLPQSQPYGASKAALINLAESLQAEKGRTLDIKLINPGFVESRLTDKNQFHMPMKITAEQAAMAIATGLNKKAFEIHFPQRFTRLMKLIKILPYWLYFWLMKQRKRP